MELLETGPFETTFDAPPIAVRSVEDHLVIEVRGHLDRCATGALAELLGAAMTAATPICLDLADAPGRSRPPLSAVRPAEPGFPAIAVLVGGPGLLHLVRPGSCWTLDIAGRRLCRSASRLQPRFVPAEHWTAISQVWCTGATLTAVSPCGTVQFSERQAPRPARDIGHRRRTA